MNARLALLRWTLRVVRREWRQHALVVALVAFGTMTATVAVSSFVRLTDGGSDLGNAAAVVVFDIADPAATAASALPEQLGAIAAVHPDIEVVASVAAGPTGIDLTDQDPDAPLGSPWVKLLDGRWPSSAGEVALTPRAVQRLEAATGERVELGRAYLIDGVDRTVVGRYENPTAISAASGIVAPGELTSTSGVGSEWTGVRILLPVAGHPAEPGLLALGSADAGVYVSGTSFGGGTTEASSALFGYVIGTVLCLQIAVLSSAGFTVLANRRRRQLGVLSALGPPPKYVGSVVRLTGLVVGVVGGLAGLGLGVALSIALTPLLQKTVDFRMSSTNLPWGYLLPLFPLAVLTAMAGAWLPAKRATRFSAVDAMADRRVRERGSAFAMMLGLVLLGAGGWAMVVGAPRNDALIIIAAVMAVGIGGLLLAPATTTVIGALATSAPVPVRVAWRDIARNRSRSAAAIAAAAIAMAIPFGLASFLASLSSTWVPRLPENVAQIYPGFRSNGSTTETATAPGDHVLAAAATVPGSELVPVLLLVDPQRDFGDGVLYPYSVNERRHSGDSYSLRTAVATPALLDLMGIDQPRPEVDLLVAGSASLEVDPTLVVENVDGPWPSALPEALILHAPPGTSLDDTVVESWLLVGDGPLTELERDRISAAVASSPGGEQLLTTNFSDDPPPWAMVRTIAMSIGSLFGLAAVAVAVVLIRVEAQGEARVLRSVGAGTRTTRAINASTVLGLTFAAAVLAVVTTFVLSAGIYLNPDEEFSFAVPWAELATLLLGMPLAGAAIAASFRGHR